MPIARAPIASAKEVKNKSTCLFLPERREIAFKRNRQDHSSDNWSLCNPRTALRLFRMLLKLQNQNLLRKRRQDIKNADEAGQNA